MTASYRFFQFLGGLAVLGGCFVAVPALRILLIGPDDSIWAILACVLLGGTSAYLFYIGFRSVRYGNSPEKPIPRFRLGRALVGAWLVFVNANNYFHPAPNLMKPSNATEAMAMNVMTFVMALAGLYLIAWGFSGRRSEAPRDQSYSSGSYLNLH
jgi:disulfide bond formation protein DsbB